MNVKLFYQEKKIGCYQLQFWMVLRQDTQGTFSAIFDKGDNFCYFLFALLYTNPFLKKGQL